jgi:hypothetical protein
MHFAGNSTQCCVVITADYAAIWSVFYYKCDAFQ